MQSTLRTVPFTGGAFRSDSILDNVKEELDAGHVQPVMDQLLEDLSTRREEEPQLWPDFCRKCLNHPVCSLLHQDPFTYRAFVKPRGYAGDAVMMDYMYGLGEAREVVRGATPLGRSIFEYMHESPGVKAVRHRRRLLANFIDRVPNRGKILAIAAGHLPEVELSDTVRSGHIEEFVAFDQDRASLSVVNREYAHLGVRAVHGSVRQILAGDVSLDQYDLIYAAGLFDYLSGPAAAALTLRIFENDPTWRTHGHSELPDRNT
jgi:hypothetical protein